MTEFREFSLPAVLRANRAARTVTAHATNTLPGPGLKGTRAVKQAMHVLRVRAVRRGLLEITGDVRRWVEQQEIADGLLTLFCRHTSASLLIQENAAPAVRRDLEKFFDELAPEGAGLYEHDDEGPDDMPAHLKTALTQVQMSIPMMEGKLTLGTWQGIYLFEHRDHPSQREIVLHLAGT